jgi:hypothetical protein
VIVDRHGVSEQPDDEEAGRDDRQRTAGGDASQAPELLERQGQHCHDGERPDVIQCGQRGRCTGIEVFAEALAAATTKAVTITTARVNRYVQARRAAGAATASINMELALLNRAFTLAVRARQLGPTRRPFIEVCLTTSRACARGSSAARKWTA